MSLKMTGLSVTEIAQLASEIQLEPAFTGESCYIATGPTHEMLAVRQSDGLFDVQLLEKEQAARSVEETIRVFQEFVSKDPAHRSV